MRLQDDLDFTTLTWVKGELDETLKQARHALESFVEDPSDASQMRFCATYLHQVQGTLRMVELYGAAMVTEEMERLATALLDGEVPERDEAYAVLMRGIVQLPDYLERLQSGHKDIPIVLLPLLNDLRAARGEMGLSESVLFTPDLSRPLPASAQGPARPQPEEPLRRAAELLRSQYQVSLLRWFRGEDVDGNLAKLVQVCDRLVSLTFQEEARRLFWVAAGVVDALRARIFEPSQELKQALGKVEREMKRLADNGEDSFRADPPRELTRTLLYFVAHVGGDHPRLGEMREAFRLDALLPSEAELEHARGSMTGHNRALLDTVASAIKEDLLRVKDALDLYLRSNDAQPAQLASQVDVLDRVSDTLGMIGLGVARRVVQDQRNAVFEVAGGQRPADEATLLDIAGALLYVEATLDDQVQQLGGGSAAQAEGTGAMSLPQAESQRVLEAVIREAHGNFQQAKQCFVAFIENNWDHAQLADVPRLLEEVAGALRIMEIHDAPELLRAVRVFTEAELLRRHRVPNGQQMDTLADALASLEYYLEAVRDHRSGRGKILEVAERSLESLGYWPVPDLPLEDAPPLPTAAPMAAVEAPAAPAAEVHAATEPSPAGSIGDHPTFSIEAHEGPETPALDEVSPVQMAPGEGLADLIVGEAAREAVQPPPPAQDMAGFRPAQTERTAPPMPDAVAPGTGGFEGTSDEIDEEIREVFVEEVQEEINNLEEFLPAWKANVENLDNLKPIRRVFHTLKGSGRLVGAVTLGEFSWKVENMLNRVLDKTIQPSPAMQALLDQANAQLPSLLAALRGEGGVRMHEIDGIKQVADQLAAGEEAWFHPAAPAVVESEAAPVEAVEAAPAPAQQAAAPDVVEEPAAEAESVEVAGGEMPAPLIDPVLFEILKAEVSGHLDSVEEYLASCAAAPQPVTDPLLRAVHTMNGAFAMTEVPSITEVVSPLEGYIKRLMAQRSAPGPRGLELIRQSVAAVRQTMTALEQPRPALPDLETLAAAVQAERDTLPEPTGPVVPMHPMEELPEPVVEVTPAAVVEPAAEEVNPFADFGIPAFDPEQATAGEVAAGADQEPGEPEHAFVGEFPVFADTIQGSPPSEAQEREPGEPVEPVPVELEQAMESETVFFEELEPPQIPAELESLAEFPVADAEVEVFEFAEEALPAEAAAHEPVEQGETPPEAELEQELLELPPEAVLDEAVVLEAVEGDDFDFEIVTPELESREEIERLEAERLQAERLEAERLEAERLEAERLEAERLEAERLEAERLEAERLEAERLEAERLEAERLEAERLKTERLEAERLEAERLEAERLEAERLEAERLEAEQLEVEQTEAEPFESEQLEAGQTEAEQRVAEELEAEALADVEAAESAASVVEEAMQRAAAAQPEGAGRYDYSKEDPDPEGALDIPDLDDELLDIFLEEGGDILDHADGLMAQLRENPTERELVSSLQRDLHTLKGGARMAGLSPIGDLGHAMESLLEMVAEGRRELEGGSVEVLERAFDRLHSMVTRVSKRQAIAMPVTMIGRIEALARGESVALPQGEAEAAVAASADVVAEPSVAPVAEVPALVAKPTTLDRMAEEEEVADVGVRAPQEQIRIRADLLDRLVNYAGEVAIYRARLEQQLGSFRASLVEMDQTTTRLREQLRRLDIETEAQIIARYQREAETTDESFDPLELDRFSTLQQLSRALAESAADLVNLQHTLDDLTRQYETLLLQQSRVSSDLQEGLMRTRMVQFESLVPRLRRIIRQTAGELGKKAQLRVEGAQGEMDRNVLDRMTAPLEHMLRNALAHGLELPKDRSAKGKPEEGTVRIALSREASEVVIRVTDDGRGMDRDAIRRKAIEKGMLKPDAELSDRDLFGFVLETGFSTAEAVSKIAGRGVGMDVVNSEIKQLGGQLFIDSERGKGTTFTVRLPFTLAVTQAVFVKMNETTYAVPIASVQGVARIAREELEKQLESEQPVFEYAGEEYAIYDLGLLLDQAHARAEESLQVPLLLARSGDLRAAICVDNVVGSREIVVKPTGPQVSSVPGIFGATIMGDGSVVVILDVAPLVRRSAALKQSGDAPVRAAPAEERRVPLVMVVDDSITMRKVTSRVLERQNYEVLTAKDGVDAIEKMQERVPDVMLLDIEMPRMDGYELATHMRNDARLKGIPIIMITSRTGEKHRQRAFEIGVDRYLGKPYQENELMRNVQEILQVGRGGGG
jgi:chemosensory pili system protein ChpA (sensor histidine kinase/response regulator)